MKNNMKNMLLRRRIMLGLASSPFSPEATAILKENFPDYWNDIKAYGVAHPEMVPYINEDPYIVISLGLVSNKKRYIQFDNNSYFNLGIKGTNDSKFEFSYYLNTTVSEWIYGSANNTNKASLTFCYSPNDTTNIRFGNLRYVQALSSALLGTHIFKQSTNECLIDDVSLGDYNKNGASFTTPYNIYLGTRSYTGDIASDGRFSGKLYYFKWTENTTLIKNLIPYVDKNNVVKLLNLVDLSEIAPAIGAVTVHIENS